MFVVLTWSQNWVTNTIQYIEIFFFAGIIIFCPQKIFLTYFFMNSLYFQSSNPSHDSVGAKNGSIRSASTISSRECDRQNGLVR